MVKNLARLVLVTEAETEKLTSDRTREEELETKVLLLKEFRRQRRACQAICARFTLVKDDPDVFFDMARAELKSKGDASG